MDNPLIVGLWTNTSSSLLCLKIKIAESEQLLNKGLLGPECSNPGPTRHLKSAVYLPKCLEGRCSRKSAKPRSNTYERTGHSSAAFGFLAHRTGGMGQSV